MGLLVPHTARAAAPVMVTNTNDSGAGSLRAAITTANSNSGSTIQFNIPTSDLKYNGSVYTITVNSQLPGLVNPTTIDATSQPGYPIINPYTPIINVTNNAGISAFGLVIQAGADGSTIQGLAIYGFGDAIRLNSGVQNVVIRANYIGVATNGSTAGNTGNGISCAGNTGTTIGGLNPSDRNVIARNGGYGIRLSGNSNTIQGNLIGTDPAGTAALPNQGGGVFVDTGSNGNVIGGTVAGAGNIISGNGAYGLEIGAGSTANNTAQGNTIGTDINGTTALPNQFGVGVFGPGNYIGGTASGAGNLISGNTIYGLYINAPMTTVQGNAIGTNAAGTGSISNGSVAGNAAVYISAIASGNIIGGTEPGAGNIISGNHTDGLVLFGAISNTIQGNFIGTNGTGAALGNSGSGVLLTNGAENNTIGGIAAGEANTIPFNATGVTVTDGASAASSTIGNPVRGNAIFSNSGLGINLMGGTENSNGVTANDDGDGDPGPNNLQNFPIINGVGCNGASLTITGSLNSTANAAFNIDIYRNTTAGAGGYGQGQVYVGSVTTPVTDVSGNAPFSLTMTGGGGNQFYTATATRVNAPLDTSEFSLAVAAGSYIVTNTGDLGPGSLHDAIIFANSYPGTTIKFNIPGAGLHTISATAMNVLPAITAANTIIDGYSQPGSSQNTGPNQDNAILNIVVNGAGANSGLVINNVPNCVLQGLVINNSAANAGVIIQGANATNNVVQGCFIGTDSTGAFAAPNTINGITIMGSAHLNTIGGDVATTPGARNVISGNGSVGIVIQDPASSNNIIEGNFIGTKATGLTALPNGLDGIAIKNGAQSNTVGGISGGTRNLISGNTGSGVSLSGHINLGEGEINTSANVVQGNYIGTDVTGIFAVPNGTGGLAGDDDGVVIADSAQNNILGGTTAGARNVISGNFNVGVYLTGGPTAGNLVQGNYIGVGAGGNSVLGNNGDGVDIVSNAHDNTIGGTGPGARNIISANAYAGIYVAASADSNTVQGNYIGTDSTGTAAIANGLGVHLTLGATNTHIGGTASGAGNVISGNNGAGVLLDSNSYFNVLEGNIIGTDTTRALHRPNGSGVTMSTGASSNVIGDVAAGAGNVIAFNNADGVLVTDPTSTDNAIRGNSIFSNGGLGINLQPGGEANRTVTANDAGDADTGPNDLQNYPVVTTAIATSSATTVVKGTLNSIPNNAYIIDLYASPSADASGYGEGQQYIGTQNVTTDASGNASFSASVTAGAGQFISATATTDDNSDMGITSGTSEFSQNVTVVPTIAINNVPQQEGDSGTTNAIFTVTLAAPSPQSVTVNYATVNGTAISGSDYLSASGTLSFAPGVTTQTLKVSILGDTTFEPDETFFVNLSSPTNALISVAQGTGTILNDDGAPKISINDVKLTEGNTGTSNAVFTVTLASASTQPISVDYATANGTATAPADYTSVSGTLNFAPGTTTQTINVPIIGDTLNETNQTFFLNLSNAVNATLAKAQGVGTIIDNDVAPTVSINDVAQPEGDAGTTNAIFTVTLSAPSAQTITVAYATADGTATGGSDYKVTSGILSFAPGTTTQTISVPVIGDKLNEDNETFFVRLLNPTNATLQRPQGTGTIVNDDPVPILSIAGASVNVLNDSTASEVFYVSFSSPSGKTVSVNYATTDGTAKQPTNYTATSGTLIFAPGETFKQITVNVNGVRAQPVATFTVTLASAVNATFVDSTAKGAIVTTTAPTPTPAPVATVTTSQDRGANSLRAAINFANANPGTKIKFNIPTRDGGLSGGVFTLKPRVALPSITANGTILDGTTQAIRGAGIAGTPPIALNGAEAGANAVGLEVETANCVIKGLTINGFPGGGVRITGAEAQHNLVQGCYIGTNATGASDVSNGIAGVALQNGASYNTIGGTATELRNIISGNAGDGVLIDGATHNSVLGNSIGTDVTGAQPVPNLLHGVEIVHSANDNIIGNAASASISVGNSNLIAFNRNDGVHVAESSEGNSIRGNSITSNAALGINLVGQADRSNGVTPNDAGDKDSGPNNLQNFPIITDTGPADSGGTELDGTFNSTPRSAFNLDFYNNTGGSAGGYGQGQQYLGSRRVVTDSAGNAKFAFIFSGTGQFFAATATNVVTGDTSEFSAVPLTISSFSPVSGPVNTLVTINVTGLGDVGAVFFADDNAPDGTVEATDVSLLSSGQIVVRVPAGATTGPITVAGASSSARTATDFVVTPGPARNPANDNFANAQQLNGDSGTVTGTNINATKEPGEPTHEDAGGNMSVWYKWTASKTGSASFDTFGSNFDTVLAVYTGSRVNALHRVVSNDEAGLGSQSAVRFQAVAKQTYYIAVDGADYGGITAQGAITLNYALSVNRPPNDNIAAAQAIRGNAGQVTGTNENATKEGGEPDHAGRPGGKSVWYAWLAPATGSVTFTTAGSDFDTLLAVYASKTEKPSVSALNAIASNDDEDIVFTSSVTFQATAGRTYYIAVDGFDYGDGLHGDTGHVNLSWTLSAPNGTPINWINRAGGDWDNAANWSPRRVPGPTDIATISLPGKYTVNLNVDATVGGLIFGGASGAPSFIMQGHNLTLHGVSSIRQHGVLKLSQGALVAQSILNLAGTCNWTGGRINGQGALTIAAGGALNIGDAPGGRVTNKFLGLKTVNNFGTAHWSGTGSILGGNGTKFKNNGFFYADGDGTFGFDQTGSANPTFINLPGDNLTAPGQFIKTTGRGTGDAVTTPATTFDGVALFNSGADAINLAGYVAVKQGILRLGGGGDSYGRFFVPAGTQLQFTENYFFAKDVASITGTGHICILGNTVNIATDVNAQSFSVCNGILTGNSDLTATTAFNWEGGGMSGRGSTNINKGANLDIHGNGAKSLLGRTLNNAGNANWTGTSHITAGEGAVINNSGTFNTQGGSTGSTLDRGDGESPTFNNSGTLNPGNASQSTTANSLVGPRSFAVSAPGLFNIFGNYTQSVSGVLNMDVGGTKPGNSYDQVKVSGSAQLNGNLNLQFGYVPKPGDSFTVLQYTQHSGNFSTIKAQNLPAGMKLVTTYTATGLVAQVLPREADTYTITGRVVNRAGDGVPGVTITRSGTASVFSPVGVTTDARGYYVLQNVASGTYTLTPNLNGATFDPAAQSVTVGAASVRARDFTAALNITGRIVNSAGHGLGNVTVALRSSPTGPNAQTAQTDVDGYYTLSDASPGNAYIVPTRAGYAFNSQNLRFPISIGSGGVSEANFTGFLTPCIIGQVRSGSDISTGLAGATVKRVDASGPVAVATTDAGGYYFFEAVPPGNYAVGPVLSGWLFNVATANVSATNNYFVFNFVGTPLTAATGGAARSKVTLSTATAHSAGQSIMLQFGGRLDSDAVGDAARYQVKINSRLVTVESVTYRSTTSSVTLGLPEGSFKRGDKISVAWVGLPASKGALLTGQVGPLTAQN